MKASKQTSCACTPAYQHHRVSVQPHTCIVWAQSLIHLDIHDIHLPAPCSVCLDTQWHIGVSLLSQDQQWFPATSETTYYLMPGLSLPYPVILWGAQVARIQLSQHFYPTSSLCAAPWPVRGAHTSLRSTAFCPESQPHPPTPVSHEHDSLHGVPTGFRKASAE